MSNMPPSHTAATKRKPARVRTQNLARNVARNVAHKAAHYAAQTAVWNRLSESSGHDDNPGIENFVGRAELAANWQINKANTLGVTVRHSLRNEARGSTRIDWMMAPASAPNHTGGFLSRRTTSKSAIR